MVTYNQNPEQLARDKIDTQLRAAGWVVQDIGSINWQAGAGQAVREYPTETGPADYILFVDRKPVGVIEAKKEALGHKLTVAEDQTSGYAQAKLKWITKNDDLPFLYEATGTITRFTDARDPKPRSREIFAFHRPETLTAIYRLLKHGKAKRILFLVDTRNLGEQAEQEFMAYLPSDDNRKAPAGGRSK